MNQKQAGSKSKEEHDGAKMEKAAVPAEPWPGSEGAVGAGRP